MTAWQRGGKDEKSPEAESFHFGDFIARIEKRYDPGKTRKLYSPRDYTLESACTSQGRSSPVTLSHPSRKRKR